MNIRPEFAVHMLNSTGKDKAEQIAARFSNLLDKIEMMGVTGRQLALVKTDLQTACFNAKKGMAEQPENQAGYTAPELAPEPTKEQP